MIPHYAGDPFFCIGTSIFLAGPTPRIEMVKSWRPEALSLLADLGFAGGVYVPEPAGGHMAEWPSYDDQCGWEQDRLENATAIVFWIPREMVTMPAMTTNIEFGMYADRRTDIIALGYPEDAPHMRYIDYCARQWGIPVHHDLRYTLAYAVELCR